MCDMHVQPYDGAYLFSRELFNKKVSLWKRRGRQISGNLRTSNLRIVNYLLADIPISQEWICVQRDQVFENLTVSEQWSKFVLSRDYGCTILEYCLLRKSDNRFGNANILRFLAIV